jgi:hypothetical protein
MNHEDYLKQILKTAKLTLEHLNINHQIEIAKFNVKRELLMVQIESIETQLIEK